MDYTRVLRRQNRAAMARNLADREARASRLSPEAVARWTALVKAVARIVPPAKRPCSHDRWERALQDFARTPPFIGALDDRSRAAASDLSAFVADVAQPGWPDPRPDLIEFALTCLEADVMLFGSGYKKRHLIRRLQQSPLTGDQLARVDRLIRRAVTEGTGREENRAYRKQAAHLMWRGEVPGLYLWLEETAKGALIRSGDLPTSLQFHLTERLGDDWGRWYGLLGAKALVAPELGVMVAVPRQPDKAALARRSAFRFLMAIEARCPHALWPRR